MILVDANILIYASNEESVHHAAAHTWLDERLSGSAAVGLPWAALLAFLRVSTNARVWRHALTTQTAWRQLSDWLTAEPVWIPQPTARHTAILGGLMMLHGIQGNLVTDAHLAALAIEHGLTLCSTDGDFARFPRLRWENPLALKQ